MMNNCLFSFSGDKGYPGIKGGKGGVGLPGESLKGDKGAPGPRGPRGPDGDLGSSLQGPLGNEGPQGEPGVKGNHISFKIVSLLQGLTFCLVIDLKTCATMRGTHQNNKDKLFSRILQLTFNPL